MITINQISSDIKLPDVAAPSAKGAPAAAQFNTKDRVELSVAGQNKKKLQDEFNSSAQVRIRSVEEINQKIKYDGYPFATDFYKAIEKLLPDVSFA